MLSQTDAVKKAWAATDRTLDIIVTIDGKDYQATEINSLNYDAGAFTGDTLGIGSTYENSVTIEFSSVVEAFKQGLTVLPKVGILVNGKFEYTKLGTFIISEVNRDRNNNLTTIKALDQMCKLEGQYKPTVSDTASPLDIIADIANQGGVAVNTGELQHLPTLPNIKRIEGQTLRTAIGWIAQLYDGFAAFDRDGKLTIRTTATPDYTITPSEYQQGGLTKNEVAYKTGGIKVTVNTKKTDDSGQEVDDTTTLQAGETTGSQIELTNDSMTSDLLTTVWTGIKDITYYPYTLNWFGNPNLEAGDWVTLTDTQGNKFNVPVNQYTMSFNGGLESTISATQSSSTAGGYAYTGSAGSIKNMIEALQVRHTASGNNVYPPSYQGQPKNPKKGDVWYKQNGNNVEVWIYQEEDGKLSWVRTPLDGEVKAELQAMGKKTNEDLTRVKSELSSEAESQWQSAKTATSETDQRLTSLQAEQNASLADLHDTADSLHAAANSLHADADSMRASLTGATSELGKDITATRDSLTAAKNSLAAVDSSMRTATSETASELASTRSSLAAVDADMRGDLTNARNSLAAVDSSLRTATSEVGNNLTSVKSSLVAVDADLRNGITKAGNDLSAAKTSLVATGNSLATATSELQRQTGQLSGSLSTADSMIMFNSNAIAEVKRTAGEISTTVSNIRVGGRNLLTNTRTLSDVWNGATETVDGFVVAKATQTGSDTYDPIQWGGLSLKSNTDYVLTFYAKASKQTAIYSYLYDIGTDTVYMDGSTANTLTTDYQRYTIRFHTATMPAGRTVNCLPVRMTENGVTAWIYGVQLEEGNTATQWQPNPADTDQAISKVSQTADAIRADLTNTKGDVASVKATANSLQSQITNNKNNIASVTQTAQGLTTRVSNAEGNVSSLQQTAQGLQTSVSDNAKNISSVKQTADSLATRMTNAEGSVSSLKQTASGLQTDVADAKKNISSVQQKADSLTTRMSNAEGNVSSLQQTAKGLQSSVADQSGKISQLQQDADGLNFTVANGSQNLILNSGNPSTLEHWTTTGELTLQKHSFWKNGTENLFELSNTSSTTEKYLSSDYFQIEPNQTYTLSFYAFNNSALVNADVWYLPRKTGSSNGYDTAIQLAANVKYSVGNAQYNKITFNSGDYNEGYIRFDNNGSTTEGTWANLYLTDIQLEKGSIATAWHPSPGDIAQLKITADGLTSKVADTQGDVSELQQTAKSIQASVADNANNISNVKQTATALQSSLSNAQGEISNVKQTASKLQSDLANAKGDISSLQQTASGLTSRVGNAEGNISQLQQTANGLTSTVSNMKVGGRNLLGGDTKTEHTAGYPASGNTDMTYFTMLIPASQTQYTLSFDAKSTHAGDSITCYLYNSIEGGHDSVTGGENNQGVKNQNDDGNMPFTLTDSYQRYWVKWTNNPNDGKLTVLCGRLFAGAGSGSVSIKNIKLEVGNTPTDWTPAPETFDEGISQIQQTADQIKADVADNKGNISSVTQTANAVKADLANTKGDVASVKAKADSLTTQLSDANGNISQLQQTAKGLQSTVAGQDGKISQLQHDADGLNFTVANGSQNLILNSGNPSTLEHWTTTGELTLQKHSFWKNGTENLFELSNTSSTTEKYLSSDYFQIEPNQTYTLSFYAFNNSALVNADVWYLPRKTGSSNGYDTAIQLAANVKYSIGNAQYNKITFNSGNYNEGYIRFDNNASTTEGTYADLYLTDIQLEKGSIATAWHPSPGDIAQLKVTADGLTSKVADTQGNVSNLQQTAQGLQTQVTNAKKDVSNLQVKANGISADLTNAKHDIASVNVKADSLTTSMANANDQISTLQHRADSITSTLSNGGRNLLTGTSSDEVTNTYPASGYTDGLRYAMPVPANQTDYMLSFDAKSTVAGDKIICYMYNPDQVTKAVSSQNVVNTNANGNMPFTLTTDWVRYWVHYTITPTDQMPTVIVGRTFSGSGSGTVSLKCAQLEYGETATPWQPSNGDISSLQQTASSLTADMKDAKGNISSLQVTAGGLNTRVTNAEHNVSSLQETADRLSGVVGDANSGLVSSVNAIPGQISSAITASKQATVIASAVDLHNMTTAGYYLLKGTLTNSPVDAWAFLRVVTSDSGDRIYHRIWKDNASTVYTEEWTGSWSDWATHINSDNLKSNVITAINQSTEGVSITGAKITLDGNVNVAPGFTLSADRITAGTLSADRISGGTLNFSNITVNGLTANSISSGSISGQNLNINLDNGTVEFTKGNLHSTDGGFNISIDNKSFYLDTGSGSKLWIDNNGFHLQESATQHLWMNKDGLHNYTDANGNGLWINDTELRVLNSSNAGLVAKDGILQFSANPIWNSDNVYSGTLNDQIYGTIGFNSNLLSSSLNGIFIKGREGVVIGTSSYGGGSLFGADGFLDVGEAGSGINLPDDLNKPASLFTKSALTLLGGQTYPAFWGMSDKARVCIGCDTYYTHNGASMVSGGNSTRGSNISINARNTNIIGYDWVNIKCRNGRIALDAQWVHSYPTYNHTTSAGANVYVAEDGALIRSSSARKYKTDIQDANNAYGEKLIEFAPKKWIDKAEKKRYEEDPENNKKPGYYYGLIADDLDAAGLDMLVNYGAEGEVEGINYDRLAVALLPVIKSLKDQVASLKEQIKALTK